MITRRGGAWLRRSAATISSALIMPILLRRVVLVWNGSNGARPSSNTR